MMQIKNHNFPYDEIHYLIMKSFDEKITNRNQKLYDWYVPVCHLFRYDVTNERGIMSFINSMEFYRSYVLYNKIILYPMVFYIYYMQYKS
jgi:hypothetical protein